MCESFRPQELAREGMVYLRYKLSTMCFLIVLHEYINIVLITMSITLKLGIDINIFQIVTNVFDK